MAVFSLHFFATKSYQSYNSLMHRVDFSSGVVTVVSWYYSSVHSHWHSRGKVRRFVSLLP